MDSAASAGTGGVGALVVAAAASSAPNIASGPPARPGVDEATWPVVVAVAALVVSAAVAVAVCC